MASTIAPISMLVMGFIVLVGGIMGFVKAKSKASLISGVVSGLLYFASFMACSVSLQVGMSNAALLSAALMGVFGLRLKKTGKFMPAGMLLILCAVELILLVGLYLTVQTSS